jgi:hypothetical protein
MINIAAKKLACILAVSAALFASNVSAGLIQGDIGFAGDWSRVGDMIDFEDGTVDVETVSGDLATTIAENDITNFSDFVFDPFAGPHALWTLGGFSFVLDTVTVIFDNSAQFIILQGTGTISGNGFDATKTNWDLSTNNLTFSTSNVTQVPEPGSLALMLLGVLALAIRSRTAV